MLVREQSCVSTNRNRYRGCRLQIGMAVVEAPRGDAGLATSWRAARDLLILALGPYLSAGCEPMMLRLAKSPDISNPDQSTRIAVVTQDRTVYQMKRRDRPCDTRSDHSRVEPIGGGWAGFGAPARKK